MVDLVRENHHLEDEVIHLVDDIRDSVDGIDHLVHEVRDFVDEVVDFANGIVDLVVLKSLQALALLKEALVMSEDDKVNDKRYFLIDARELAPFVRDLPAGAMRGMKRAQEGFPLVLQEIVDSQEKYGKNAGILSRDVEELVLLTKRIEKIHEHLPYVQKLLEVLIETELAMDDRRQQIIRVIAKTVDNAASLNKDPMLLGVYENTRRYRSAAAQKGVKTRRKKAAALASVKKDAGAPEGGAMAEVAGRRLAGEEKPRQP